jgi:kynureninase
MTKYIELDANDPLKHYREQFHIPRTAQGRECIYLCGNSLGLQPKRTAVAIVQELTDWQNLGVEGHFHAKNPWMPYHEFLTNSYARLVGAKPIEVVAMNTLTVNLHLLMVSFYQPTPERHKILIEGHAFPSDRYAVESQIRFHGFDPAMSLIALMPREGEKTLRSEDIEAAIDDSVALVLLGGVNYYTGQVFEMQRITQAAHDAGAIMGLDLAHAAGNVPLQLHDWGVDFAAWCSYKYLNSGPGSVAGAFVHERYANKPNLPRFAGWWGHDKATRFKMAPEFEVTAGADGWQLSNPPILSLAAVKASLEIFDEVGMEALRKKSLALTAYAHELFDAIDGNKFSIMTPRAEHERGSQISLVVQDNGRKVFDALTAEGVICDWREPDCIRIAFAPLYNSFADVHRFVEIFKGAL